MAIRFPEAQARPMGRASRGVRGISLGEGDVVVSMESLPRGATAIMSEPPPPDADEAPAEPDEPVGEGETPAEEAAEGGAPPGPAEELDPDAAILTVCAHGYGKRTKVTEYRPQNRGGKGLIDIKTTERNGSVVGQLTVGEADHIMLISDAGTVLRCRVREVSCIGRNTQGVRIIRLGENERIVAVEKWAEAEDSGEPGGETSPPAEGAKPDEQAPAGGADVGEPGEGGGGGPADGEEA
jgi:DNA gyrase subunit A